MENANEVEGLRKSDQGALVNAIEVAGLRKSYKGKLALDSIDLKVPAGSVCALLGSNGAGKSTLMKVLAGLQKADAGKASILSRDPWSQAHQLRLEVAYVAEKPKFYDWMTVAQTGWFAAGFYPKGYEASFQTVCQKMKIDPSVKLSSLSKGGYARVALALALAMNPTVLLLDEPTSGLDLFTRRDFLSGMVDLAGDGKTVLISSHNLSEVERIASQVVFIDGGKIVLNQTMEDLKKRMVRLRQRGEPAFNLGALGKVLRQGKDGPWNEWIVLCHETSLLDPKHGFEPIGLEEVYEVVLGSREEVGT